MSNCIPFSVTIPFPAKLTMGSWFITKVTQGIPFSTVLVVTMADGTPRCCEQNANVKEQPGEAVYLSVFHSKISLMTRDSSSHSDGNLGLAFGCT
jgi:hypothetical protein